METCAPEDILTDSSSHDLNKKQFLHTDRKSVLFYPSSSDIYIYMSNSGKRVLKFSLNGEDNSYWLDCQSVRVVFTLQNLDVGAFNNKLCPLPRPYGFFRRMRIIAQKQVVEDVDNYN